jgi:hypothetical protein
MKGMETSGCPLSVMAILTNRNAVQHSGGNPANDDDAWHEEQEELIEGVHGEPTHPSAHAIY